MALLLLHMALIAIMHTCVYQPQSVHYDMQGLCGQWKGEPAHVQDPVHLVTIAMQLRPEGTDGLPLARQCSTPRCKRSRTSQTAWAEVTSQGDTQKLLEARW